MSSGRKLLLYAVYALVIIGLGVGIVVSFHHGKSSNSTVASKPAGDELQGFGAGTSSPSPSVTATPKPSPSPTPTNTATANASATAKAAVDSAANASLVNTGPGSTVAVFVVATTTGTLLYRRRQLARA